MIKFPVKCFFLFLILSASIVPPVNAQTLSDSINIDQTPTDINRIEIDAGGGKFRYMVQMSILFQYRQKSEYDHSKKEHRTTSMMNDVYSYSPWVKAKKTAKAQTAWYWSYSSNNSYWSTR